MADRVARIPDPAEPVPKFAWPTLVLFGSGLALWGGSTALALTGLWPWPLSVLANWLAVYLLFTVAHEAAHHSASAHHEINEWFGRIATFFVGPIGFPVWRFVHMQHHRFVNVAGDDPDYRSSHSRGWERPLRWLTMDVDYLRFYFSRIAMRPRRHDKDLPTMWESTLSTGGADDGVIAAGGIDVALALCWELIRSDTARRVAGRADLVLSGSARWSVPSRWPYSFTRRPEPVKSDETVRAGD